MKTRKLKGFGSYGVEVYDLDLQTSSPDEILELGFLAMDQLLVVIKKDCVRGISRERFFEICTSWVDDPKGDFGNSLQFFKHLLKKYNYSGNGLPPNMDEKDRIALESGDRMRRGVEHLTGMARVTGIRDKDGSPTGMFSDGELEWHCNNQGSEHRAPGVGLISWEGSKDSVTEFLSTVDAYATLSPEWRKRVDELVAVHRWVPNRMAPGLNPVEDELLRMNMCPVDGVELPMAMTSPGGHKGMHFAFTTIDHFKGHTREQSLEILDYLRQHTMRPEYMYAHPWDDGDLLFFDNAVTLHRRPTRDCSRRLMYRMTFNYGRLVALRAAQQAQAAAATSQPRV